MELTNPKDIEKLVSSNPKGAVALIAELMAERDELKRELGDAINRYGESLSNAETAARALNAIAEKAATKDDLAQSVSEVVNGLQNFLNGKFEALDSSVTDKLEQLKEDLRKYRRSKKGRRLSHNEDLAYSRKVRARQRRIFKEFIIEHLETLNSEHTLKQIVHDCWTLPKNQPTFEEWAKQTIAGAVDKSGSHVTVGYPNYEAVYAYFAGNEHFKTYLRPGARLKRYE